MDFSFYHLKRDPFAATSEPEVQFSSRSQKEALQAIIYGIEGRQGFVAILGEAGVGKTTILRSYLERVDQQERLKVIYLSCIDLTFSAILDRACQDFDVSYQVDNLRNTIEKITTVLVSEYKKGKNVVLVLDDAHLALLPTLENLLLLYDIEIYTKKLLQIVFVGQPEFEQKLKHPELQELKNCLSIRSFVSPFTKQESVDYVQHQLAKVSMQDSPVFTPGALKRIVKHAGGNPGLLNQICTEALDTGIFRHQKPISVKIAQEVIADFDVDEQRPSLLLRWGLVGLGVALLATGLLVNLPIERLKTASIAALGVSFAFRSDPGIPQESPSAPTAPDPAMPETQTRSTPAGQDTVALAANTPTAPAVPDPAMPKTQVLPGSDIPDSAEPETPAPLSSSGQEVVLHKPPALSTAPMPSGAVQEPPVPLAEEGERGGIEPPVDPQGQQGAPSPKHRKAQGSAREAELRDTHVVCVTSRPRGDQGRDIILMDYQGQGIRRLIADGALNLAPILSPDGTTLAYTSYRDGSPAVYLRNLRTATEERLNMHPGLALPGSWSPDGHYLALSKSVNGNTDIFLYHAKRRHLRRLTTHTGIDISPSFAPDSTQLVFTSNRSGSLQLYLTDVHGRPPVRLTSAGSYNTSAVWSPRDDTIAFLGRSEKQAFEIYTIRADGTNLRRLTHVGSASEETPTWAPDGRFLMYTKERNGVRERRQVRADGQGDRVLSGLSARCHSPQWVTRHMR